MYLWSFLARGSSARSRRLLTAACILNWTLCKWLRPRCDNNYTASAGVLWGRAPARDVTPPSPARRDSAPRASSPSVHGWRAGREGFPVRSEDAGAGSSAHEAFRLLLGHAHLTDVTKIFKQIEYPQTITIFGSYFIVCGVKCFFFWLLLF